VLASKEVFTVFQGRREVELHGGLAVGWPAAGGGGASGWAGLPTIIVEVKLIKSSLTIT
jgi:hypothetical protein